jgi:hypothetical protein
MRRLLLSLTAFAVVVGVVAPPAASAQQSLSLYVGGFVPRPEDARDPDDVLVGNLSLVHPLVFRVSDFNNATFGGEWLVGLGNFVDAGMGVGFYQETVPTINRDLINENGNEIFADLKLRIVPFSATVRFLPLGHRSPVQPYIGAGVGVFVWRYSESGDFVASDNVTIVHGSFVGTGTDVGPVILGGVKFPIGPVDAGGEIRYQSAVGTLPADQGFAGSTIDLGGFNYLFTFAIKF